MASPRPVSSAPQDVRHSPLEALLRAAGATMQREFGTSFATDFGSVAGEVAVCLRAVGVADRSDLVKLDVHGPAADVAAVVTAVAGVLPRAGRAVHVRRSWWSGVDAERVFVLVDLSQRDALVGRLAAAAGGLAAPTWTDVSCDWAVIAVIGPRAEALMRAPGLAPSAALPAPGEVVELDLAGAEVVLVRESPQEFLVSVAPAQAAVLWHALHEAGKPLGVASVGREAHERFEIAAGIRRGRVDHSGW